MVRFFKGVFRSFFCDVEKGLRENLKDCSSVLDLACGADSPLGKVRGNFWSVGVDLYQKCLDQSRTRNLHDDYLRMDVLDAEKNFGEKSFDAVIALDVIEHLDKEKGRLLIAMMERIARKKVVLLTPNGYLPQGEWENNPWQVHRSGWNVREMKEAGFRVIGINGWKPLKGEYYHCPYRPKKFWLFLAGMTQVVTRHVPDIAFQMLCTKRV